MAVPVNPTFTAGLFDSPWVVLAILVGSAVANWLAKRRQEKQTGQPGPQPRHDELTTPSRTPPGEFNLEETLRRLMGEEPPPPRSTPPVIPRSARPELPPTRARSEDELLRPESARQLANLGGPVLRPPVVVPPADVPGYIASAEVEQAEKRFAQLAEQVRQPAKVVTHLRRPASRSRRRGKTPWRDARSVRRSFVASLVFAPPKSIEP